MPRGLVPPGYRYLGPFNDLNRGEPTNENDAAAQQHDIDYGEQGILSYVTYNQADEDFLQRLEPNDVPTDIANRIFRTKQRFAPRMPGRYDDRRIANLRGSDRATVQELRDEIAHDRAGERAMQRAREGRRERVQQLREANITPGGTVQERAIEGRGDDPEPPREFNNMTQEEFDRWMSGDTGGPALPNIPDEALVDPTAGMEIDQGGEPEAARVGAASTSGSSSQQSKETPISIYPTLTYGLQETHTTILPWSGWVSFGWLDKTAPLKLALRMNSIWDPFPNAITDLASGGTIAAKAWHNRPVGTGSANQTGAVFPKTMPSGTTTTERPQWRDWWAQVYEYYTVLGCEWKVTITNTETSRNADVVVGIDQDSYSDVAGATGNITPEAPLAEMIAFKGVSWKKIDAPSAYEDQSKPNTVVINGRYKPGQIKRNIKNDGDVKTWTATSTTLPTLKDTSNLYFFQDALNPKAPNNTGSGCGNVQIDLKYIVQFKDLKVQARYPNTVVGTGLGPLISMSGTTAAGTDMVRYTQE